MKWLWFEQAHTLRDFQAFDKAAKGPLSAASLLVTLGRRPHLAMIGAVLVIAALAIDPFIQQVIDFPSQPIELSSNASIPRATTYGAFNLGSLEEVNAVQSSYGNQLSAAVLAAIYNPDAASLQVAPFCSTGNCSFPSLYRSLAVCSRCVDITDLVQGPTVQLLTPDSVVGSTGDTILGLFPAPTRTLRGSPLATT